MRRRVLVVVLVVLVGVLAGLAWLRPETAGGVGRYSPPTLAARP